MFLIYAFSFLYLSFAKVCSSLNTQLKCHLYNYYFSNSWTWKQHSHFLNIHSIQRRFHTKVCDLGFLWESHDQGIYTRKAVWREGDRQHIPDWSGWASASAYAEWCSAGRMEKEDRDRARERFLALQTMVTKCEFYPQKMEMRREVTWLLLWPRKTSFLRMRVLYLIIDI